MKKWNIVLLTIALCFISSAIFAHALWIETAATGKAGKEQVVRVYYGEYAEGERDSVAKWYSDVKDFELWLVGPDQKKIQLKTVAGVNYFEAKFTPTVNGEYTLAVSHQAKALGGTTKYHFLASTNVLVGAATASAKQTVNALQLNADAIAAAKVNGKVQLTAYLKNAAASGKKVSVFSPKGWTMELTTNSKGEISFTPPFAGRYVIEVQDMDKTAGEHYGKPYQSTWSGATYSFEVK